MDGGDPPRPPHGLLMQMQQMQAQSAASAQTSTSLASPYWHLHGTDFRSPAAVPFSQHHHHHFLHQQAHHHPHQQQQQQQTHHPLPHHHQEQQQQQQQLRQDNDTRNHHISIHSPSPMRHNPPSHPNPVIYPPETPPHMIPHQLNPSSSPSSGVAGMGTSTAVLLSRPDPVKRKRGRPRKYTTDANGIPLLSSSTSSKAKNVGRGSAKRIQRSTIGTAGHGFTSHVISVSAGEDVTAKIMSFCQHGPWALCMLSANGAISSASLRHAGILGGPVTYEGRFEVLSLSGLFLLSEIGGVQSRSGGLSVSLAGQDGHVIGGKVAGPIIASSPVQVVVGTFFPDARKNQSSSAQASVPAQGGSMEVDVKPYIPTGVEDEAAAQQQQCALPVMKQVQVDTETCRSMQDRLSDSAAMDVNKEEHHQHHPHHQHQHYHQQGSHVMSLQSADWAGCHFNLETSGPQGEQI